ncbi:hypothetical protein NPIL_311531 [Nephila pilipes]|uniref:Uncharacterized protein n=1 Tax=Nephila pilipes TaxID=299642 RepID=A0A8X6TRI2_NEPPI|nr:hypothetical protein NPIL_311531 [Nephila pilipes]
MMNKSTPRRKREREREKKIAFIEPFLPTISGASEREANADAIREKTGRERIDSRQSRPTSRRALCPWYAYTIDRSLESKRCAHSVVGHRHHQRRSGVFGDYGSGFSMRWLIIGGKVLASGFELIINPETNQLNAVFADDRVDED